MLSIFGNNEDEIKQGGSLLDRLKQSVSKTRSQITAKVEDLISGEKKIDPELLTKLENALLAADLGPRTTHQILEAVRQKLERHALGSAADLKAELKNQLLHALRTVPSPNGTSTALQKSRPHVIFVVGVNGTGKTTTIGKRAHRLGNREDKIRPRPRGGCLRRAVFRASAKRRRRHRGHRRTPAHKIKLDGRTRQNETHGHQNNSGRS